MSEMKQWTVTGTSMVVEAEDQFAAVDRAQESSGWHWEAREVGATDDRARTDHSTAITALRAGGSIEEVAASDLLELHDRTGLNLHQAPRLLEFVQEYAEMAVGDEGFRVQDNHA